MTSLIDTLNGRSLLLDFDGPICGVFAGYPAQDVASHLRTVITDLGYRCDDLDNSIGPIEILHWTGRQSPDLTIAVEEALTHAEQMAIQSATSTAHAVELIRAANKIGDAVAIVSNNSTVSIWDYLTLLGLTEDVKVVVGRPRAQPTLMKPNPAPVREAADRLRVPTSDCVLIGDATTDIEAAHAAGAAAIGFANKPHKVELLVHAGADAVVTSMSEVTHALAMVGQP